MRKTKYPRTVTCSGVSCCNFIPRDTQTGSQKKYCSPRCRETTRVGHSEETKRKIGLANSVALKGRTRPEEVKDKIRKTTKGMGRGVYAITGEEAVGSYIDAYGYRILTMVYGHPLRNTAGEVAEHRLVLWNKLGCETRDCQHPCHWCGKLRDWNGLRGLVADHLDEDRVNNVPENLVVSCRRCNWGRSRRKSEDFRQPTY